MGDAEPVTSRETADGPNGAVTVHCRLWGGRVRRAQRECSGERRMEPEKVTSNPQIGLGIVRLPPLSWTWTWSWSWSWSAVRQ